jgi:phenylacetate-coenzyme A ligase PaaK-like adenylate-forming protein
MRIEALQKAVFEINDEESFQSVALDIFRYQVLNNQLYGDYCRHLGVAGTMVTSIEQIPFLPISFFRSHLVMCGKRRASIVFSSSGTTANQSSQHHLADSGIYVESFTRAFNQFYGHAGDYCILALLPSYLEREGSSLVFMTNHLIRASQHPLSGFYLDNLEALSNVLNQLNHSGQQTILLGVSFALLDLAAKFPTHFPELIIIETGGMKGRGRELIREELHLKLMEGFGVDVIHSEYGMTELLSQAYSSGHGIFRCPHWMRIMIRDVNDPLSLIGAGKTGGINVIDLANIWSCSFIATQDLGKCHENGSFEVLGRFDHSDVRGCNLMLAW